MISAAAKAIVASVFALSCVLANPKCAEGRSSSLEPLPPGAIELTSIVPSSYRRWWGKVEDCSGKKKDFNLMRWYVVPTDRRGFWWNEHDSTGYVGYFLRNRQAIAIGSPWVADSDAVMHESLHAIASPRGHDPVYYLDKCKAIVPCNWACRASP